MPLPKPHKGESQDDFMGRCMHEAYGADAPSDRTQEQAVAMCFDAWRSEHGGDKPKSTKEIDEGDLVTPEENESHDGFVERCIDDYLLDHKEADADEVADACEAVWETDMKSSRRKPRTKQSLADLSPDDAPDPEEGEDKDDYIERCIDELADQFDLSGDDVDEHFEDLSHACETAYENFSTQEYEEEGHKPPRFKQSKGVAHFKTHAEEVQGMEFVLSDETPDRIGDIIVATGWEFEQFNKNPIALFNHNANFPIGRWQNLRIDGTSLKGHLIMAPKGTSDRIDELRKLIDAGILKAVSVGFRDIESEPLDKKDPWGGRKFTKQELVETSLVSVPANPNALAVAKSLNISATTIDLVFAKHGNRDRIKRRSGLTGKHAQTSRKNGRGAMTPLAERIATGQTLLTESKDKLNEHWGKADNTNVSDADMQIATDLNATIAQLEKQLAALVESERLLGQTVTNGGGTAQVHKGRAITVFTPQPDRVESPS